MKTEDAYRIIGHEADHLHRMPHHQGSMPLSRRDYIRGRLLRMVTMGAVHRAEYETPDE